MKHLIRLFAFLPLLMEVLIGHGQTVVQNGNTTTYTSANPTTDLHTQFSDMIYMDWLHIISLGADLSGGIKGTVQSGGSITLSVFQYNTHLPGGIGDLLYRLTTNTTTTAYSGTPDRIQLRLTNDPNKFQQTLVTFTDHIREMGQRTPLTLLDADCGVPESATNLLESVIDIGFADPTPQCVARKQLQPVIVVITQTNAVANSVKIPGVGIIDNPNSTVKPPPPPFATVGGPVLIGSHRGKWEDILAPENTEAAIRSALNANVNMIEIDLWLSGDGIPILFHDRGMNKRTTLTGAVSNYSLSQLVGVPIRNRFDELITNADSRLITLERAFDILKTDTKKTWINLDRAANSIATFKKVYVIARDKGMLDRCIFKGKFDPATDDVNNPDLPTVANFRRALHEIYPNTSDATVDNFLRSMYYTPILIDNRQSADRPRLPYDDAMAEKYKQFMLEWINGQFADGFELNFKAYPSSRRASIGNNYTIDDDNQIILLRSWSTLGGKNFVDWVHGFNIPVGMFANEPEVGAVPGYLPGGARDISSLQSGTVFEDPNTFEAFVNPIFMWDFRNDPDFYIRAGADFVITDRPDQLLGYLKATGRN